MLLQIFVFLLDVVASILAGACLLRLYMQHQRVPFGNPVGQLVFALSDWLVLPLRRLLPAVRRWDLASLVAAYLVELAQYSLIWLMVGRIGTAQTVLLLALFGLLRLALSALTGLVLVYAILSWLGPASPIQAILERLCEPLLRPFRRWLPAPGGFDLSALVVLVLLQVATMVLVGLQQGAF